MTTIKKEFDIEVYASIAELNAADAELLAKARESTKLSYAPYSNFNVGAAALLVNCQVVVGSNQENASYPASICAERILMGAASTLHPKVPIDTMAISYNNQNGTSNKPISPCGICRQYMVEYEKIVGQPFRIILSGMDGEVYIIAAAHMLLPLSFTSDDMAKA